MRRAFTLIEVNLAMLIMAGGILSIVGLYAFGFRESKQSREDVTASALADAVVGPLVMAISATNVTWSNFRNIGNYPSETGWGAYLDSNTGLVNGDPIGKANAAFSAVCGSVGAGGVNPPSLPNGYTYGLVVLHEQDSAVVSIGFRAADKNRWATLMSMPLFYTEVRFQGISQ